MTIEPKFGEPYTEFLGLEYFNEIRITHAAWHSSYGEYSGTIETGIRNGDDFDCIQHGWPNWQEAGEIIKRCLTKNWDVDRIANFLEHLKDRRHRNRVKAKTE